MLVAAGELVMTMAHLQLVEPVVTTYKKAILAAGQWPVRDRFAERLGKEVIAEPQRAYLMSDEDFALYDSLCKAARDKARMAVSSPDNCPLLEAETLVSKAENTLLNAMSEVTKVDAHKVLCLGLEKRREFIDLTLRLLAPFLSAKPQ